MIFWIAGYTGFLGSSLALTLANKFPSSQIIGVNRKFKCTILRDFEALDLKPGSHYYSIDDMIVQFGKPDYLFITSGSPTVTVAENNVSASINANITYLNKLLHFVLPSNPFVVLCSSAAVKGNLSTSKEKKLLPTSIYGIHKKLAEELFNFYQYKGLKGIIIRPFSIFGPGQRKQIFWDLGQKCLKSKKKSIELKGDGSEVREFVGIDSFCCKLTMLAIDRFSSPIPVDLGSGNPINIKQIVEIFSNAWHYVTGDKLNYFFSQKKSSVEPNTLVSDSSIFLVEPDNYHNYLFVRLCDYIRWLIAQS
jgi:nucleoside-diphosphate-sugar epimerase